MFCNPGMAFAMAKMSNPSALIAATSNFTCTYVPVIVPLVGRLEGFPVGLVVGFAVGGELPPIASERRYVKVKRIIMIS